MTKSKAIPAGQAGTPLPRDEAALPDCRDGLAYLDCMFDGAAPHDAGDSRYRNVVENLKEVIFQTDQRGRWVFLNPAWESITGYPVADSLGLSYLSYVHPDDRQLSQDLLRPVLERQLDGNSHPLRFITRDGRCRWLEVYVQLLLDEQGGMTGTVGTLHDVTAKYLAETELSNATALLGALIDNLQAGVLVEDENGRVLLANRHWFELFGLAGATRRIAGLPLRALYGELAPRLADAAAVQACHDALREAGRLSTCNEVELRDGRVLECDFVPIVQEQSAPRRLWIYRDITARKQAEAEIRHARAQLTAAIESLDAGLALFDRDDRLVICNRMYKELYPPIAELAQPGISLDQLLHTLCARGGAQYSGLAAHSYNVARGLAQGGSEPVERRFDARWIRTSERKTADGSLVSLHTDITSLMRSAAELARAKEAAESASHAKSSFLANMSHEIRTPLNGVIGMLQLALETGPTAEQRELVALAKGSADTLLTVINEVLDFSKIEAGYIDIDPVPFALRDALAALTVTMGYQARSKGLELVLQVAPELPERVVGDPARLRQILTNLVGNAIKFSDSGRGSVAIDVWPESADAQGGVMHFCVRDHGIGIPADKLEAVFLAFQQADNSTTRKYGGTGLGLSISRRLVEFMGGQIWAESEPGLGSRFHFTIHYGHAGQAAAAGAGAGGSAPVAAADGASILLVEDNPVNQQVARHFLERMGHRVWVADSGRQALEQVELLPFDLILMDVQMPEMDGFEATARLRASMSRRQRYSPIVAMTARAMAGDRERCLRAGMDDYLAKPIRQEELHDMLRRYLPGARRAVPVNAVEPQLANALQELKQDPVLLTKLIEVFLQEYPPLLKRIAQAVTEQDGKALAMVAHTIKSVLGVFHFEAGAAVARDIERLAAVPPSWPEVAAQVERLKAQTEYLAEALRGFAIGAEPC